MQTYLGIIQTAAKERINTWSGELTLTTDAVMPISLDVIIQVIFEPRIPTKSFIIIILSGSL